MRHGSLFSGIGGFDLAAQCMGWTNVFHTEWNEFGQKVLQYHFPNSISYHDIIKTDYSIHNGDIDIITGGFPCQPFSLAGKRKGTDDERYLWHEMLRAIQQIRPTYVVAENVRGLLTIDGGLVFEQVCADLEAEGYEVQPVLLPAAGVNAPHRRDRIFIIAYSKHNRHQAIRRKEEEKNGISGINRSEMGTRQSDRADIRQADSNTNGNGCNECNSKNEKQPSERGKYAQRNTKQGDGNGNAANTNDNGNSSQGKSSEVEGNRCGNNGIKEQRQQSSEWTDGLHGLQRNAANTKDKRHEPLPNGWQGIPTSERSTLHGGSCDGSAHGRWQDFPTESAICGGNDGIPDRLDNITFPKWRNESIKAYGNAVVPQLILPIFQTIEKLHREKNT